jgi:dipeptidyl aminopeptidase/acylaminoacyl peptidase
MLKAASPLQQAARIKAPRLLVHGERDRRVPIVHARGMRDALRQNGQGPEWLVFPDEAHGWQKLENQRAFALRMEAFLARHLK